jgi:hypothetical protein
MRNTAPPILATVSALGCAAISAPTPAMPAEIRTMSDTVHTATTASTCSPRMPWRNTKAFCAPIAAMRASEAKKPTTRGELMGSTLGK